MAVKMRLDLGRLPESERRAFGAALVGRFQEMLPDSYPKDRGYRHSVEMRGERIREGVPLPQAPPGTQSARLLVTRGMGWGLRVSVSPETEPGGSLKIVIREALPLMEKLKQGVLILAAVVAVGIGILSFVVGITEGNPQGRRERKGMFVAALLFGGLGGLAAGVAGLLLLGPVHLLCRRRLREDVRRVSERLREGIREEAASLKAEVPLRALRSKSGCLFAGAVMCGAWLVHSVLKARAATVPPYDALWILSCVMAGLILTIFLGGHLSEEYGFND